jgi:hypothetical protein
MEKRDAVETELEQAGQKKSDSPEKEAIRL